ncbi:MFS transporter [Nocardia abscessus]|uniref:MFS transporter n=1 Tax=Nocardia abscessus TaxID=120957 RepID=UPI002456D447|nr:MFS transporter [Nocardia abscessus]
MKSFAFPRRRGNAALSEPIPPHARRAAVAGFLGTFIEYYDFALYGVLTVYFAPLFFPADNEAVSFLLGLAIFGAGFVARPVGGIVFGRIGDRRGRRTALIVTVALMGVCSTLMGLLPTYHAIGIFAPIALVALRIGQGLSAGAEMLGSVTFAMESAPPSRRSLLASLTPYGAGLGGSSGAVLAAVLTLLVSGDFMAEHGWRIPFLVAAPLTFVAYFIRRGVEDSPEFVEMARKKEIVKSPLRETLGRYRPQVLIAGGIAIGVNGAAGVAQWFGVYLAGNRHLAVGTVLITYAASMVLGALWTPVWGAAADRFGRQRLLTVVLVVFVILAGPILWLLSTAENPFLLAVGMTAYLLLTNAVMAPGFVLIAELFPREVRYTGANFGQNIGTVLGGGAAPLVCGALLLATGSILGPILWVFAVGVIGLAAIAVKRAMPGLTEVDKAGIPVSDVRLIPLVESDSADLGSRSPSP